jgi:hypothetical protein
MAGISVVWLIKKMRVGVGAHGSEGGHCDPPTSRFQRKRDARRLIELGVVENRPGGGTLDVENLEGWSLDVGRRGDGFGAPTSRFQREQSAR